MLPLARGSGGPHSPLNEKVTGIPDCETMLFRDVKIPCYTFLYSPNTTEVATVVKRIQSTNSPMIPDSKVKGFATADEADNFMLK